MIQYYWYFGNSLKAERDGKGEGRRKVMKEKGPMYLCMLTVFHSVVPWALVIATCK